MEVTRGWPFPSNKMTKASAVVTDIRGDQEEIGGHPQIKNDLHLTVGLVSFAALPAPNTTVRASMEHESPRAGDGDTGSESANRQEGFPGLERP